MKKLDKIIKCLTLVQIVINITLNVLTFLGIKPELKNSEQQEQYQIVMIETEKKHKKIPPNLTRVEGNNDY